MNTPLPMFAADRSGRADAWLARGRTEVPGGGVAQPPPTGLAGRVAALALYYLLAPFALPALGCFTAKPLQYATRFGPHHTMEQTPEGPLLVRRRVWLREIVQGRMNWVGPLPRTQEQLDALPRRARKLIGAQTPGIFALSDLQGVSNTEHPDEWAHAMRQCSLPGAEQRRAVLCHLRHWF